MSFKTHLCTRFAHRGAALAVLLAAMSTGLTVSAQLINDFDSGLETWRFDFGGPAGFVSASGFVSFSSLLIDNWLIIR